MKDNRFIELLNLYIDRQITVAETAELEAEIQQDPKRQAIYRQYCHIHTATKLVYDGFRANASEQTVLPAERTGVVELFETKRRPSHFAYYAAAGIAAAACLTLIFLHRGAMPGAVAPAIAAQNQISPAVPPVPVELVAVAPAKTMEPVVGPVSLRNSITNTPDFSAMLAALREQDEERAMSGVHGQNNRVSSLFDDGQFNVNHVAPLPDSNVFRIQQASAAQPVESTVFQFQR